MTSAIVVCLLLAFPSNSFCSSSAPKNEAAFEGSAAWKKLDLRLRQAWSDAIARGNRKASFECLMKTSRPASQDDRALLQSAGFSSHTVIGVIQTGSVKAGDLPAVANLDFVQAMELAAPLSIKRGTK